MSDSNLRQSSDEEVLRDEGASAPDVVKDSASAAAGVNSREGEEGPNTAKRARRGGVNEEEEGREVASTEHPALEEGVPSVSALVEEEVGAAGSLRWPTPPPPPPRRSESATAVLPPSEHAPLPPTDDSLTSQLTFLAAYTAWMEEKERKRKEEEEEEGRKRKKRKETRSRPK